MSNTEEKQDVYTRITNKIITSLEQGVRPWMKPWNAEHAAGKITRPLRHHGQPYSGINILMLWASAMEQGFAAPIWMTFKQALELNAHVRKGEKGSLVVYANSITRTEHDDDTGEVSSAKSRSSRATQRSTSSRSTVFRKSTTPRPKASSRRSSAPSAPRNSSRISPSL